MTPQERLNKFTEEFELLVNKYRCIPIVVARHVDDIQMPDGSTMSGIRRSVEYAALPDEPAAPPPQTDKQTD